MNDEEIKLATCQVICADKSGTGWLIAADIVLTAYHCITPAIKDAQQVTLRFGTGEVAQDYEVTVLAYADDMDVCLLLLPNPLLQTPIKLSAELPKSGTRWYAYGFPAVKLQVGHRVDGEVLQTLDGFPMKMDVDLTVDPGKDLTDYEGLSGAALICGHSCLGMVRINIDKTIGAVSIACMTEFLSVNGVLEIPQSSDDSAQYFAERSGFIEQFEELISCKSYVFLEGAPGIGKSTFCREFRPQADQLEVIGVYSLTEGARGVSVAHRAQPEVFFDWLDTVYSIQSTGKPARLSNKTYSELIIGTNTVLQSLAERSKARGKIGVLFIDGLNEIAQIGIEVLQRFVDLLPITLSSNLVIVLTGTSFDNVAAAIGNRLRSDDRVSLPKLSRHAEFIYCSNELDTSRVTPRLVAQLCDRALGHPLYLRYLIDFINNGGTNEELDALPTFTGSIRDYYETIWAQLLNDQEAIHLLGIIARLRWSIPTAQVTAMLMPSEIAIFVPTLSRIRHLLKHSDETEIYHASFADFLAEKTRDLNANIHVRLANYCREHQDTDYGVLSCVYHALRGGTAYELQAVAYCQQEWVDHCVTLGVEPDVLLTDIEEVLAAATQCGSAVDVVRMLLLTQRLQFRYDTLFTQSAALVAGAMIALGKTKDALQYIIRYGHLIVPIEDIFQLALRLIQANELDVALDLLEKADQIVLDRVMQQEQRFSEFLHWIKLRQHLLVLMSSTERDTPKISLFMSFAYKSIYHNMKKYPKDKRDVPLTDVVSDFMGSLLCIQGYYIKLSDFPTEVFSPSELVLNRLFGSLLYYYKYSVRYDLYTNHEVIKQVFSDIDSLLTELPESQKPDIDILNTLVMLGASWELINKIAEKPNLSLGAFSLVKADNVTVDLNAFYKAIKEWRLKAFFDPAVPCPSAIVWSTEWKLELEQLIRAVAWCDGVARRAAAMNDKSVLEHVKSQLSISVLQPLCFTLNQRVSWEQSYAIPEAIFPQLYLLLTELCVDCFPEELTNLLAQVKQQFSNQCGLYAEGFRQLLWMMLDRLSVEKLNADISDVIFDLAICGKDYVLANIKNRHELVPELLQMIPIFTRLQAQEEAHHIYRAVLSVSMGPSWYKEDQFSLMISTIENFPALDPLNADVLPRVAASLESASGEMTFERYVRYDKAQLLGELCRRGHFSQAIRYFQYQTCGSSEELLAQASDGELDRVSQVVGMRYPGGALDEQDAIAYMLKHAIPHADWQVCWSLLDIYLNGDDRHLDRWGKMFAELVNQCGNDPQSLQLTVGRINLIVQERLSAHQRESFAQSFASSLMPNYRSSFEQILTLFEISEQAKSDQILVETTHAPPNIDVASTNSKSDREAELEDSFIVPGMFGAQSVMRDAEAGVQRAQSMLRRRNIEASKAEAVKALQIMQDGKWSIWEENNPTAMRAATLLRENTNNAESLVRLYASLLQTERYCPKWVIADHLIKNIANYLSSQDREAVINLTLDHVEQVVGDTKKFYPLLPNANGHQTENATEVLYNFLMWILDHPQWERRDNAASMILWLLETNNPNCLPIFLPYAFSTDSGYRADVINGALDIMSREKPLALWERIEPLLNIDEILTRCNHVGRIVTLLRIVKRAESKGSITASTVASRVQAKFQSTQLQMQESKVVSEMPGWAQSIEREWEALEALSLTNEEIVLAAEQILKSTCLPLDVKLFLDLERVLSKGFREPEGFPLNRWGAKVRYALHLALYPYLTLDQAKEVEKILRIYNPEPLHRMRQATTPMIGLLDSLLRGGVGKFKPSNATQIYLDYQENVSINGKLSHIEITSMLIPSGAKPEPLFRNRSFVSTQLSNSGSNSIGRVCGRVNPVPAFFGSFTPAVPHPNFLQLIGAKTSDTVRVFWRTRVDVDDVWQSRLGQGSVLVINRQSLKLPRGWKIFWAVMVNRKVIAIIDRF
ncbi:MAG: AVAST type 1 anti-phage system protease Avs1b [Agitococcus sp.]|nr:AVAST type 1 anti-phage system protease Avs1b [Agitococcus sp.]